MILDLNRREQYRDKFKKTPIVEEALSSLHIPYDHLINEFVPDVLNQVISSLGLKDFTLSRRINFSSDEALAYGKSKTYQWFIKMRLTDDLNYSNYKLLELPFVNKDNVCIINGFRKIFSIKLKRRNVTFYSIDKVILQCNLINLRNRRLTVRIDTVKSTVHLLTGTSIIPLIGYLIYTYGALTVAREMYEKASTEPFKGATLLEDGLYVSTVRKSYQYLIWERLTEIPKQMLSPTYLLSRDAYLLEHLLSIEGYVNQDILEPYRFLPLISFMLSEKGQRMISSQESLLNKNWITVGGFLKDLIERAFLGIDLTQGDSSTGKKFLQSNLKDNNFDGQLLKNKNYFDWLSVKLNLVDLKAKINSYVSDGSFTQILEDDNPITTILHARKVSLLFKGLISKFSATSEIREVNPFLHGRLCPISTTEGQTIGLIKHLALCAKFNKYEDLLVPYMRVKDGKITSSKVHWLNFYEEFDMVITDLTSYASSDEIIKCRVNDSVRLVHRDSVNYVMPVNGQSLSLSINMLNHSNSSEPDRMLMAGNMLKQSSVLKYSEVPLIGSELSSKILNFYSRNKLSWTCLEKGQEWLYRSSRNAIVKYIDGKVDFRNIHGFVKNNSKTADVMSWKRDMLLPHNSNGRIWSLGNNLRCGYMIWNGYAFEDSLVISDRIVNEEIFTSLHVEEITVPVYKTTNGEEQVTRNVINAYKYNLDHLDENGVVREGTWVNPGDILVAKVKPIKKKEDTPEQRLLLAILGERNLNVRNDFFTLPQEFKSCWVLSVDYLKGRTSNQSFDKWYQISKDKLMLERNALLLNLAKLYFPRLTEKEYIKLVLTWTTGKRKVKLPYVSKVIESYEVRISSVQDTIAREDCLLSIKLTLAIEKKVQLGDKLTGFHGNKGIVSRIVSQADMPFDKDGRPLDIVISNLSVYGRLNFSQMKESKVGGLNESFVSWIRKVKVSFDAGFNVEKEIFYLRSMFKFKDFKFWYRASFEVSSNSKLQFVLDSYASADNNLIKSITDTTDYTEMQYLTCGITGRRLSNPIHVGIIHVLKLIHTVDTKFTSRSIGSSSIKFNQPTRGKHSYDKAAIVSDGQAQKIGTMEKDALIGRGLPSLLHELFTLRSDVITLRRKVLTGEVLDKEAWEDDWLLAESTKVFLYYTFSLGLNFEIDREGVLPRAVRLNLVNQEKVFKRSKGEVRVADTVHYRTKKGVSGGLFCPKIFGSDKNWACDCEKYVGNRYVGIVCPNCGVLVASNRARRAFFGHIKLEVPMINVKLAQDPVIKSLFGTTKLTGILNRKTFICISNDSYVELPNWRSEGPNERVVTGGEALDYLISKIDLRKECRYYLIKSLRNPKKVETLRKQYVNRVSFIRAGNSLKDLIIRYLPVMPKSLRPLMFTGSGSYISTDINSLYLQVLRRNIRLRELKKYKLLPFIIEHAKGLLQESLTSLLWKSNVSSYTKDLIPISDQLKGKTGILRQHLLSKRVNCCGRSTLILNPHLPAGYCGVPKAMLLKIFLPLIQKELVATDAADSSFTALNQLKEGKDVTDIIAKLCKRIPILLNRNPTLHTLSMQAFYALPMDNLAISLHPLHCAALGADFDGDTASIYVALMKSSQKELIEKVYDHSVINVSNNQIVHKPIKEIGLILYIFTLEDVTSKIIGNVPTYNLYRLLQEYGAHQRINWVRRDGLRVRITLGRAYLINGWESISGRKLNLNALKLLNANWSKGQVDLIYRLINLDMMSLARINELTNWLKDVSNEWSTKYSLSFPIEPLSDAKIDWGKRDLNAYLYKMQEYYDQGLISINDWRSEVVNKWQGYELNLTDRIKEKLKGTHHELVISSAYRGSWGNLLAISNARGMVSLKKNFLLPVMSSMIEGYNEMDFLTLSTIMDKLVTKALGTAKGGYFNRQTVELLRECLITSDDCGSNLGIEVSSINLTGRIEGYLGRLLSEDLPQINMSRDEVIDSWNVEALRKVKSFKVRSPITCQVNRGVCQKCFGYQPGLGNFPTVGRSVGTLAALALSEPVTQMLLQTKHLRHLDIVGENIEYVTRLKIEDEGYVEFTGNHDYLSKEELGWRYLSREHAYLTVNGVTLRQVIRYGDLIFNLSSKVRKGEKLFSRSLKEKVYASFDGTLRRIECKQEGIDVYEIVGNESSESFFLPKDSYEFSETTAYVKGEVIFNIKRGTKELEAESLDTSFMIISNLLSLNLELNVLGDFDVRAPCNGVLSVGNEKLIVESKEGKASKGKSYEYLRSVSKHARFRSSKINFWNGGKVRKGDLIYSGDKGTHPMSLIKDGDYVAGANYYVRELENVYISEGISVHPVYVELFVREFTLLGFSSKDHSSTARNLFYLTSRGLPSVPIVRVGISKAYVDNSSPLSIISYEDVIRNSLQLCVIGAADNLLSINSNLIMNKIIPIENRFDSKKWNEFFDL